MSKSFSIFQAGLFLILQVLIPIQNFPQSFIENPLHRCQGFKTEMLQSAGIASDNVNVLYLPLPTGTVKAVRSESLETVWQTEVGGEINGPIIFNDSALYVASTVSVTQPDNSATKTLNVQSLSKATGITQWKKEFAVSKESQRTFIISDSEHQNELYVLSDKGNLSILKSEDGQTEVEKNINKTISFPVLTIDRKIYFGTDENKIAVASNLLNEVQTTEITQLGNQPTALLPDKNGNLFAGDKFGTVYGIQTADKKIKWRARTGGEITSIKEYADKLLVSSSDNYIYLLTKKNGSRIWKKRLEGKMQGDPSIDGEFAIVSPIGTNTATIVDLKNGKTVNLISVGESAENSFTMNPLIVGRNVIFSTLGGFYSYGAEECTKVK